MEMSHTRNKIQVTVYTVFIARDDGINLNVEGLDIEVRVKNQGKVAQPDPGIPYFNIIPKIAPCILLTMTET